MQDIRDLITRNKEREKDAANRMFKFPDGRPDTRQEVKKQVENQNTKFEVRKVNQGTGPVVPVGSKVKIHYVGKLDDRAFDNSR